MTERRAGLEFRIAGRTLNGIALRYGDISPDFRERFEPGAFGEVRAVPLNLQHDRQMVITPDAMLTDSPRDLRVRAELPPASAALALVRRGALSGFSIEFYSKAERRESGIRVVEKAELTGLALVDAPAYPASGVEVRARSGRTLRAAIPSETKLACECSGAGCRFAEFARGALQEAFDDAFKEAKREIVAAWGSYSSPLASRSRGTLRGRMAGDDLEVDIDLPDSDAGRAVIAAQEDAGIVVRPFVMADASDGVIEERAAGEQTMVYRKLRIRAVIVSATDAREGWPDPVLIPTPDVEPEGRRVAPVRRRIWL